MQRQKQRKPMSEYRYGLPAIRSLYEEYISEVEKLEKNKKPADGILGFGKKISEDPCHERFSEQLQMLLENYAGEKPDSSDIREVLSYIYSVQNEHRDPVSAYWLMKAVHGFTIELAGMLSGEDAAFLYELYEKNCPRRERFPIQKKVLKALKMSGK